ncbi:MAG TPA: redoxin family protein [Planctomycetota bacterium]|nr:redoxin family protein [Planctomycetota bacterium]
MLPRSTFSISSALSRSLATLAVGLLTGCGEPSTVAGPTAQNSGTATTPATPAAPAPASGKSLYDRLGGVDAITAVVGEFVNNLAHDPKVNKRFAGANIPHLKQMLIEQICAATGGPQKYTGGDMKTVHTGMGIKPEEFGALVGDLVAALDKFKVPEAEKNELLGALGGMQKDIVESGPSVAERLEAMETRLMRIQLKLDEANDRLARLEAGQQAAATNPAAPAQPAAVPVPAPAPAHVEVPMGKPIEPRAWTPEEAKFFGTLVSRLETEKTVPAEDNQRPSWLGKPLEVTRFITSNGDVLDLKQFKGKKILLVVLRGLTGNSVCIHCSAQTIALVNAAQKFQDRKTEVVFVYPGKAESVPAFIEATQKLDQEFKMPFKIALDVDLMVVRLFDIKGSLAKPTSILVDEQGLVQYVYIGQQPADRPSVQTMLDVIDGLGGKKQAP